MMHLLDRLVPIKLYNYLDSKIHRDATSRVIKRKGDDGTVYVYTLRDFEEHQCIFVHIPKTAGMSVSRALFGHCAGGHKTVDEYRRIFGERFWTYDRFTFTRNPYVRLVSAYQFLRRGGHPAWPSDRQFGRQILQEYDGFQEFVLRWLQPGITEGSPLHFYPQMHFLTLGDEIAVDMIGHVETIDVDFARVCRRLEIDAELPTANATPGPRKPLAAYYDTDRVVHRVQDVYATDFEHLGYSRDVQHALEPPSRSGRK